MAGSAWDLLIEMGRAWSVFEPGAKTTEQSRARPPHRSTVPAGDSKLRLWDEPWPTRRAAAMETNAMTMFHYGLATSPQGATAMAEFRASG